MIRIDLYTRCVLTVIALSLATIATQLALPSAKADSGISRMAICDYVTERCARVGEVTSSGSDPTDALLVVTINN
jgi:hypothetical protein